METKKQKPKDQPEADDQTQKRPPQPGDKSPIASNKGSIEEEGNVEPQQG